ncbi:MAG: class I SAM-dependent rRNA methyltransferase [Saprospiraceae bacterium]|nr:class I SAM-dependent rRNA methyltransferase [Saprospiraceae bacterium]MDW8229819.1 class I SAM-dependent rRNA methyltransferase [Saprospiraceae bacterium]
MKLYLKPGKEASVRRFHPWIFSGALQELPSADADGEVAEVYDHRGRLLGVGHFHRGNIAVRLLTFEAADLNAPAFWEHKLQQAFALRQQLGLTQQGAYRLVHGEGDDLSGLVIDLYGQVAVVQCHSIGMHRQRHLIAQALQRVVEPPLTAIFDKSRETLPENYAQHIQNGYLAGSASGSAIVCENDVRFRVDWESGQKTGFFLDQRDNRQLLGRLCAGKRVLNAFAYTGGFSCYALRAGAALVHSVDISAKAIALLEENIALNQPFAGQHCAFTEDALAFLKKTNQEYDIVVVDPPAFAKSLDKRHNAVQGYKRLNAAAIQRVAPGGLLFTFSCSQVVSRELFEHTVAAAAIEVGRPARVLYRLSQGADHPTNVYHPEGAYLKGLVVQIGSAGE